MPRKPPAETPLYVKLPTETVEKLDREAAALGMRKKDFVASLVTKYVSVDGQGPTVGTYTFQAYDPLPPPLPPPPLPEIMTSEQAALFLQLDERMLLELAETKQIPGKRLGPVWRFSRDALVAWVSK